MKNYIKYLKENPKKMGMIQGIITFFVIVNVVVNVIDFALPLTIAVAIFSALITALISLQVWGEYKKIEGLKDAIIEFFKW